MARAYGSSAHLLMKRETTYGQAATGEPGPGIWTGKASGDGGDPSGNLSRAPRKMVGESIRAVASALLRAADADADADVGEAAMDRC